MLYDQGLLLEPALTLGNESHLYSILSEIIDNPLQSPPGGLHKPSNVSLTMCLNSTCNIVSTSFSCKLTGEVLYSEVLWSC